MFRHLCFTAGAEEDCQASLACIASAKVLAFACTSTNLVQLLRHSEMNARLRAGRPTLQARTHPTPAMFSPGHRTAADDERTANSRRIHGTSARYIYRERPSEMYWYTAWRLRLAKPNVLRNENENPHLRDSIHRSRPTTDTLPRISNSLLLADAKRSTGYRCHIFGERSTSKLPMLNRAEHRCRGLTPTTDTGMPWTRDDGPALPPRGGRDNICFQIAAYETPRSYRTKPQQI